VRERFANWLARHTGGSDMASRAVLAALQERLPDRQVWREEKKGSSGKYIDK
jgi:hypothetical protein